MGLEVCEPSERQMVATPGEAVVVDVGAVDLGDGGVAALNLQDPSTAAAEVQDPTAAVEIDPRLFKAAADAPPIDQGAFDVASVKTLEFGLKAELGEQATNSVASTKNALIM